MFSILPHPPAEVEGVSPDASWGSGGKCGERLWGISHPKKLAFEQVREAA